MNHTKAFTSSCAARHSLILLLRRSLLLLLLCALALAAAQRVRGQAAGVSPLASGQDARIALHQSLLDLSNFRTVMCVAAHPDDEDGATLTVLRRKYGVHTVTLFSTYGEGGQNAVGPELYEELGAIRARETLAAAAIQGSEASFLALRDFGFSKSAEEAFQVWGHTEALRRMVLKIRTLHPDAIITNHDTLSGHGHHQATGRLVIEAFDAAADPLRFPEQLREQGVTVWQVQRLFVRVNYESGTGSKAEEEAATRTGKVLTVNPNERDEVRGTTYAEQALQALQRHASQGPWPQSVPTEGARIIRYRLAREAGEAAPFPVGAQTFLDGLQLPPAIASRLAPLTIEGQPLTALSAQPERAFAVVAGAREAGRLTGSFAESNSEPHLRLMNERLNLALAELSSIDATLTAQDRTLIPNAPARLSLKVTNRGVRPALVQRLRFKDLRQANYLKAPARLAPGKSLDVPVTIRSGSAAEISVPHSEHLYDGRVFGQQFDAEIQLVVNGHSFSVPVTTRVDVSPVVEIAGITPSPLVLTPASIARSSTFTLRLINHQHLPFVGSLSAGSSTGTTQKQEPPWKALNLPGKDALDFKYEFGGGLSNPVNIRRGDKRSSGGFVSFTVKRDGHPAPIIKQVVPIVWADARVPAGLRVGYVRSYDDTLRDALAALGVEAKELTVVEVQTGELKTYDTIIIDNRGYQAHPELVAANARLLEYVHQGGTLIVFYHKANEWNPDAKKNRPQLAPYPLTLGTARITDENALITFVEPQSALLHFPNEIEKEDFDGWIQERGLYYPKEWDARYSAPFAAGDAGEAPLRGGLLAADFGRGRYLYTSMVWYRQLRAGVPGAYRVFANMISNGRANAK